jgi:photosystem II stability/assembly factor-like uncharacterized protein
MNRPSASRWRVWCPAGRVALASAMVVAVSASAAWAGINVWTSHGPGAVPITALAIDPATPSTLYAGTDRHGLYKSTDGAATWVELARGFLSSDSVSALAIDPHTPTTLYVGTINGGVYKSIDGGATWSTAATGLPGSVKALVIDPSDTRTLYAGAALTIYEFGGYHDGGVFKSTDGSMTWQPVNTGLPSTLIDVQALAIYPRAPTTLYAGTEGYCDLAIACGGVFKSTDGAVSWQGASAGLPGSAGAQVLAIDLTARSTLYVGTSVNGAFKSTDGAMSWQPVTGDLPTTVEALATNAGMPNMLLAGALNCDEKGTCRGGMFESTDGASSWRAINSELRVAIASGSISSSAPNVLTFAIDPRTPTTMYVGTVDVGAGGGVFKSTDAGASWRAANSGFLGTAYVETLGVDPTAPGTAYAGATGVFKSTDGANSWQAANAGLPDHAAVRAIAIDPRTPTTLYVGAGPDDVPDVYRSTDGGASWSASTASTPGVVLGIVIDPMTPSTLYAGMVDYGVYKSTDAGRTWAASTGLPMPITVHAMAIDPSDPSTLYAGAFVACYVPGSCGDGGVYKSTDAGRTWVSSGLTTNLGGVISIAIDAMTPRTLYAAMGYGLGGYKSTDAGTTWNRITFPFPNDTNVTLTIDPRAPTNLYAATIDHGAWKSVDAGTTWSYLGGPRGFGTIAIDPISPHHRLYAAASDGGVFALEQSAACTGDCNGNGYVAVDDLLTLVNIALGIPASCPSGVPGSATVDIALILQAVNAALYGCPT